MFKNNQTKEQESFLLTTDLIKARKFLSLRKIAQVIKDVLEKKEIEALMKELKK